MRARHLQLLAGLVVAGAALRFSTLDVQSYWLDEVATVTILRKGFGDMISAVVSGESTPPLYYILAWCWSKLFGTGEEGLRSLSAALGTATIAVAYLLGRRVAGRPTGLVAAALVAFNPLLVWYSQEARSYALMVLLSGLTLLALVAALEKPSARRLGLWALASIAVVCTHYYAGFLVVAEALWLVYRGGRRTMPAAVAVGVAAGALLPLALHQRQTGAAAFISDSALARRVVQIPKQFALGYHGPAEIPFTIVAALLLAYALFRLVASAPGQERHRALLLTWLGAGATGLPLALALAGADYVIARNVLAAWLPLGVAVAAGFAARRAQREGLLAAALLCALGLVTVIAVASDPRYQRDDWRGVADYLGRAEQSRAVVVSPASGRVPLLHYLDNGEPLPSGEVLVKEIAFVAMAERLPGEEPHPPRPDLVAAANFREVARRQAETYTVVVERSDTGAFLTPVVGASPLSGKPAVTLYQP